jgi:predicted RNase H-like HicB family nuclease
MSELAVIPNAECRPVEGIVKPVWKKLTPPRHEFAAAICPDEDGGFSVFAVQYPGVISQGDTPDEAKANIAEAFMAMLQACRKQERPMEYADAIEVPANCEKAWITIDG